MTDLLAAATDDRLERSTEVASWPLCGSDKAETLVSDSESYLDPAHDAYFAAHRERMSQTLARIPAVPENHDAEAIDFSAHQTTVFGLAQLGYRTAGTFYAQGPSSDVREPSPEWVGTGLAVEYWVDFERHCIDRESSTVDVVLAAEIIEHLPTDPQQLLVEANRLLRPGGLIIVTTPNVVSWASIARALDHRHPFNYPLYDRHRTMDRHHLEFSPDLLAAALRGAGFDLVELATPDVWEPPPSDVVSTLCELGFDNGLRGDCLIAVGLKVSDIVDRTPPALYTGERSTYRLSGTVSPGQED